MTRISFFCILILIAFSLSASAEVNASGGVVRCSDSLEASVFHSVNLHLPQTEFTLIGASALSKSPLLASTRGAQGFTKASFDSAESHGRYAASEANAYVLYGFWPREARPNNETVQFSFGRDDKPYSLETSLLKVDAAAISLPLRKATIIGKVQKQGGAGQSRLLAVAGLGSDDKGLRSRANEVAVYQIRRSKSDMAISFPEPYKFIVAPGDQEILEMKFLNDVRSVRTSGQSQPLLAILTNKRFILAKPTTGDKLYSIKLQGLSNEARLIAFSQSQELLMILDRNQILTVRMADGKLIKNADLSKVEKISAWGTPRFEDEIDKPAHAVFATSDNAIGIYQLGFDAKPEIYLIPGWGWLPIGQEIVAIASSREMRRDPENNRKLVPDEIFFATNTGAVYRRYYRRGESQVRKIWQPIGSQTVEFKRLEILDDDGDQEFEVVGVDSASRIHRFKIGF